MTLRLRYLLPVGMAAAVVLAWYFAGQIEPEGDAPHQAGTRPATSSEAMRSAPGQGDWNGSPFGHGPATELTVQTGTVVNRKAPVIFGRNGRPIDFGGKNALAFIAQSSAAARSGNIDAAYQTYHAESVCANNDEPVAEFQDPAERTEFLHEREALETLCAGVSPAQVQERLRYLATAARAGKAEAQIDFYMEGPDGKTATRHASGTDPDSQKWKDEAVGYLKAAAGQGEPFALGLLSQAYSAGELVPRDPKMALTYTVAEATARETVLTPAQLARRFGKQMTPAEFQQAWQSGVQIGRDCCKK